jgi:hypothetical protein
MSPKTAHHGVAPTSSKRRPHLDHDFSVRFMVAMKMLTSCDFDAVVLDEVGKPADCKRV